jgi:hypothetical protein
MSRKYQLTLWISRRDNPFISGGMFLVFQGLGMSSNLKDFLKLGVLK